MGSDRDRTPRGHIADLDDDEFMAVLDEGARRFNAELDRLGISRVILLRGNVVLRHPDGSFTKLPEDRKGMDEVFDRHKVTLDGVRYP